MSEKGKVVSLKEKRLEGIRQEADRIQQDDGMRALIEAQWDASGDVDPPEGTRPYYAMLLADLLLQRDMTPEGIAVMNQYRDTPYDPDANAAAIVECVEKLTGNRRKK